MPIKSKRRILLIKWIRLTRNPRLWVGLAAGLTGLTGLAAGLVGLSRFSPRPPTQPVEVDTPTAAIVATPASETRPEWEKYFQAFDVTGALGLYELTSNRYIRYNPPGCAERFPPAATFTILNALIGLETGAIPDADYQLEWDGTRYPVPAWNRAHTLRTAMRAGVGWYNQELARRIGPDDMQAYVAATGYGNGDISGEPDTFWLEGSLRISADEQIGFLTRLYVNALPFSAATLETVRDMLVLEQNTAYTLSGVTGWVTSGPPAVGWFVGYLERDEKVYFFATRVESARSEANLAEAAEAITRHSLTDLGELP